MAGDVVWVNPVTKRYLIDTQGSGQGSSWVVAVSWETSIWGDRNGTTGKGAASIWFGGFMPPSEARPPNMRVGFL